jgi:hypothetical protein
MQQRQLCDGNGFWQKRNTLVDQSRSLSVPNCCHNSKRIFNRAHTVNLLAVSFLRTESGQHSVGAILDPLYTKSSNVKNTIDSDSTIYGTSGRQNSQASASTSYGGQQAVPRQDCKDAGSPRRLSASTEVPRLSGPPRLVRPNRPRDSSRDSAAEDSNAPSPLKVSHGSGAAASMDRAPAMERVYWQGSVMSREAVLGRMLVALPHGTSVAEVLKGQMLCSKQITRCGYQPLLLASPWIGTLQSSSD